MAAEEAEPTIRRPPSDDEEESDSSGEEGNRPAKRQEQIPDAVDHFLGQLLSGLETRNVREIHKLYEESFNKIADKTYKNTRWPSAKAVEEQISDNTLFLILYKELYYRHVYSRLQVTYADRKGSWENYCKLLGLFIDDLAEGQELSAAVPAQWLWDMLDEFIYHYQTYCMFRNKSAKTQKEADITQIKENPGVFDTSKVLNYLQQIIQRSNIDDYLSCPAADRTEEKGGAYKYESVRLAGYFSLMQLLRMHSLLGDYRLAMDTVKCIDFHAEVPLFYKIPACHVTLYYYMGFAYMMMRRYTDAINTFNDILVFLQKTSGVNSLSYQYDQMVKKQDQMYALLLICLALCPHPIDELIEKTIHDKHAEKQGRLSRGEDLCFEELFSYACPKFVSASLPDFDNLEGFNAGEAHQRQLNLFQQEVKQQQSLPRIGAYMKLYTAIQTSKLARLCEMDEEGLRDQLMCVKHKTRQLTRVENGPPLEGEVKTCAEVQFYIDSGMVHIDAHRPQRPHADVFLEQIVKFGDILKKT